MSFNTLVAAGSSNAIPNLDKARITRSGVVAAYSLRRLFEDYTGPLVRVRRSGDGRSEKFRPGSTGALDAEAVVDWVNRGGGTKTGTVAKWFDQSGHGNYAGSGGRFQPIIVSNGAQVTENARPALQFGTNDGGPRAMMGTATAGARFNGRNVPLSAFVVAKLDSLAGSGTCLLMQAQFDRYMFIAPYHYHSNTGKDFRIRASRHGRNIKKHVTVNAEFPTGQALMSYVFTGALGRIWHNGQPISPWADQALADNTQYTSITIGGRQDYKNNRWTFSPLFNGNIAEIILYNQDRRFVRPSIEANIMNYYKIRA